MASDFDIQEGLVDLENGEVYIGGVALDVEDKPGIARALDELTDALAVNVFDIVSETTFTLARRFLSVFQDMETRSQQRVSYALLSGYGNAVKQVGADLSESGGAIGVQEDGVGERRRSLELYTFLMQWLVAHLEAQSVREIKASTLSKRSGKTNTTRKANGLGISSVIRQILEAHQSVLKLHLHKLWLSHSEMETFIHLVTKATYRILENTLHLKDDRITQVAYEIIAKCVTEYNHAFAAQTTLIQNLQYYEYMSEPMAALLYTISVKHEHPHLSDTILTHIADIDFSSQASSGPKSYGKFLTRYAELAPKLILRQMVHLIKLLDVEHYMIRCSVLEVIGTVTAYLLEENNPSHIRQIEGYFDLLEERFRDVNAYVRSRNLQVLSRLCEGKATFPRRRGALVDLTSGRLEDTSSIVRVNAIRLMVQWVKTHPYMIDGGELDRRVFENKLKGIRDSLEAISIPEGVDDTVAASFLQDRVTIEMDGDEEMGEAEDAEGDVEMSGGERKEEEDPQVSSPVRRGIALNPPASVSMSGSGSGAGAMEDLETRCRFLLVQRKYYTDALAFVAQVEEAIPLLTQLLASTTKSEVIEAMEFFVVAQRYHITAAAGGIRRMVHLIWTKDANATQDGMEGRGIRVRLLDAYREVYFTPSPPHTLGDKEGVREVARRLIHLASECSLAALTSLEQLLMEMVRYKGGGTSTSGVISSALIHQLWAIYSHRGEGVPTRQIRTQRRGAILLLTMLSRADRSIVEKNVDLILRRGGLDEVLGGEDLILARYSCQALQCLASPSTRLPLDDSPIFPRLEGILLSTTETETRSTPLLWFSLAEAAVNTVYDLAQKPDVWAEGLLKAFTRRVFICNASSSQAGEGSQREGLPLVPVTPSKHSSDADKSVFVPISSLPGARSASALALAQWIFLAGHIALRQIVYMEEIEQEWKRRRVSGAEGAGGKDGHASMQGKEDELEQVGGGAGADDEAVMEAMHILRERYLLDDEGEGLLQPFANILPYISSSKVELHPVLLLAATLSLGKLMCVSSTYCEQHLPLLLSLLEKSTLASARGNLVIVLGDLAVSFSSALEPHVPALYSRLNDEDSKVRRAALLVLTHLILHGMIKVKGHLGDLATSLEDGDGRNADLARLFFTQFAAKEPGSLLSHLPDLISHLSTSTKCLPDEDAFSRVMRFLLPLAISTSSTTSASNTASAAAAAAAAAMATVSGGGGSGDGGEMSGPGQTTGGPNPRSLDALIDRLSQRFPLSDNPRHWRDASLCLSLLPFRTERAFRRLQDSLPLYRHTLHDPMVMAHFKDLLLRAKGARITKMPDEYKVAVEEFSKQLAQVAQANLADATLAKKAQDTLKVVPDRTKASRRVSDGTGGRAGRQGKRRKVVDSESESDFEMDMDEEGGEEDEADDVDVGDGVEEGVSDVSDVEGSDDDDDDDDDDNDDEEDDEDDLMEE